MDLLQYVPDIKRCREYKLYPYDGSVILDLNLLGGAAYWGHRPKNLGTKIKNQISTGAVSFLPTKWHKHLKKHLKRKFPEDRVLCFSSKAQMELFLSKHHDLDVGVWRTELSRPSNKALTPVLPQNLSSACLLIVSTDIPLMDFEEDITSLDAIALIRGIEDFFKVSQGLVSLPANSLWTQQGRYLTYINKEHHYKDVFQKFLDNNILLSHRADVPSILPDLIISSELHRINKVMVEFR
ncbi:hypothetical protein [Spirochaeta cellobiosiphila]|uniref:hypothetical protein n=1 Tax=Spirochaeta cellobiosiphila TaxID=504483 RepID=UPI0003F7AD4F|nr:hypothetical protein [Spirochaeta cellobiosiphila]